MAIRKEDLYRLVDNLDQQDTKAAYDFLEFLVKRSKENSKNWEPIDKFEPDPHPLSIQEWEQFNSPEGYVTGESGKRAFNLQADLP